MKNSIGDDIEIEMGDTNVLVSEYIYIYNITHLYIKYIVNISNNSVRLLLSYITKLKMLNEDINMEKIRVICTQISYSFFEEYTDLWLNKKDFVGACEKIMYLSELGYSVMDIIETYFNYIKNISTISDTYKFAIFPIICKYINIFHSIHEDAFELTLMTYQFKNII